MSARTKRFGTSPLDNGMNGAASAAHAISSQKARRSSHNDCAIAARTLASLHRERSRSNAPTGGFKEMVKQERVIAFICGISLAYVGFASAQRIVSNVQDYLGPRFRVPSRTRPHSTWRRLVPAPRIRFVIGIRSPLMPADSITRRSRRGNSRVRRTAGPDASKSRDGDRPHCDVRQR